MSGHLKVVVDAARLSLDQSDVLGCVQGCICQCAALAHRHFDRVTKPAAAQAWVVDVPDSRLEAAAILTALMINQVRLLSHALMSSLLVINNNTNNNNN